MHPGVTVDLFVSVDGWAGSDGLPGYFGYFGDDLQSWIGENLAARQTLLVGRRSYQLLAGIPSEVQDESWRRTLELDKVVFSRTLTEVSWPNTRLCSDDAVDEVRRLKDAGDTPLRTMGSLSIVRQMLGAGLVDRLRLMTFPLLAGPHGREAAFAQVDAAALDLVEQRVLDGRLLLTEYCPTGAEIPR